MVRDLGLHREREKVYESVCARERDDVRQAHQWEAICRQDGGGKSRSSAAYPYKNTQKNDDNVTTPCTYPLLVCYLPSNLVLSSITAAAAAFGSFISINVEP